MNGLLRIAALAVTVGALVLAMTACGSSSTSTSASSGGSGVPEGVATPATESQTCVKRGGTLTVLNHDDFEHIDPGQAYFTIDYEALSVSARPLISYAPNNFKEATPDMAEKPAEISSDAKTLTYHIRHGVHFGPPVNREVTAKDVEYAIDRDANPNVANPYLETYFQSIEGLKTAKGGPIPGVKATAKYTLVIHLTEPKAQLVNDALALPGSAPVPAEYARKFDAKSPSEYGNYQVATGPYMFKADGSGKILGVGYQPGKSATLVRNPNWNASTDRRPACLDQINISIGGDTTVIGRQTLEGSHSVQNDTPAQPIIKLAYEKFRSQLQISPGAGDHYVALNNSHGPFRNVNLRKAVWAALDRKAMDKARGGSLVSDVMTHFIIPEVNGFEEAGGLAGPKVDYNEHLEGDIAVAEKYMRLAGYPSGKYTGSQAVQIVGSTGNPANVDAELVNQTLKNLGFKTKFNLVDQSVMYSKYCGVVKEEIDVCPNVGWGADFSDPQAVLEVPFAGYAIVREGTNSNWGQVNDPQIDSAMRAAGNIVGTQARADAWAQIDRELVEQAVAAPYDWTKQGLVKSKDVAGVGQLWNSGSWDYSYTSLK